MKKLTGMIVLGLSVALWCGNEARAQEEGGAGGLKGLPGAVKGDVGNAVNQEVQGAAGKFGLGAKGQPAGIEEGAGKVGEKAGEGRGAAEAMGGKAAIKGSAEDAGGAMKGNAEPGADEGMGSLKGKAGKKAQPEEQNEQEEDEDN